MLRTQIQQGAGSGPERDFVCSLEPGVARPRKPA